MQAELENGTIRQLSPTVFAVDDTLIVVRHLSGWRGWSETKRLIYVIDDDWRAGISDSALPLGYRAQLAVREAWQGHRLERRADVILASTPALAHRLRSRWPGKSIDVLQPAWPLTQSALAARKPVRLAYLSAATHAADFAFLEPILEKALSGFAITLTLTANAPLPPTWKVRDNVSILPVMGWQDYRNWMQAKKFDIGLYPALGTPFNRMRSRNKLLEFDQFGAALLCSHAWPAGAEAASKGRCIALPDDQSQWSQALSQLINVPDAANVVATANRAAIASEDPPKDQRSRWLEILGRDSGLG